MMLELGGTALVAQESEGVRSRSEVELVDDRIGKQLPYV
jgi:hypothetical protein